MMAVEDDVGRSAAYVEKLRFAPAAIFALFVVIVKGLGIEFVFALWGMGSVITPVACHPMRLNPTPFVVPVALLGFSRNAGVVILFEERGEVGPD